MKIKLNTTDLLVALNVVRIVVPRPVTPTGGAGYLFVVQSGKCHVYSRDDQCVAKASFDLLESDGDGQFVYPAEYIEALKYLDGQVLTFEAEAKEDERFIVRYESEVGARTERSSFNPKLLATCDEDLNATTTTFEYPTAILRDAIDMSRPFLAKPTDTRLEEQYKTIQVFDAAKPEYAKGDGQLFSSDSVRAYYFYCEAFTGKGIGVHSQHLSALTSFLSKSEEKITFRLGAHYTFVENGKGHVLGWPKHAKTHPQFKYYPLKSDKTVLILEKVQLLNSLKYTRSELEKSRDKIKILFNHERQVLQFGVSEGTSKTDSLPVTAKPKMVDGKPWMEERDWSFNINIDHMIDLVEKVKNNQVELHVLIAPPGEGRPKEVAMFRTIDDFKLDVSGKMVVEAEDKDTFKCRVTRFMPSKE